MKTTIKFSNRSRMGLRRNLVLQISVLLLYLSPIHGTAQIHTVTNCTEAALRAAMAEGGTVTFVCDGTITLVGTITITNDTILDASSHHVTISGNGAVRVFEVGTNVQFSVGNLTIADGLATSGAGLLNDGGVLNLVNCSFTNNSVVGGAGADGWGGSAGEAGGSGAGGAVWNSGLMFVSGCTFAGNSAVGGTGGRGSGGDMEPYSTPGYPGGPGGDGAGGAVFNCGTAWFVNCTLAFNTGAGGAGGPGGPGYYYSPDYPPASDGPNGPPGLSFGGIYDATGQCYLTNCTVVFNSGTGIRTTGTDGTKLINTLLAENSPGGNGFGGITDLGYNLSSDDTCSFTEAGSMNNTYALLGPLSDNGGSTLTVALLPGCRAIDAGDTAAAPPTDQRGVARPFGSAADIGAYEYNEPTNPGPPTVVTECTEGALRAAMFHLAKALGPRKIRVNTVVPTWMWGPPVQMYVQWQVADRGITEEEAIGEITVNMPLGEIPADEDVAESAIFLCSDRARTITGQTLYVNSGEFMT